MIDQPVESLKWVGIIAMLSVVITALIILYVRPLGKNASVSAHLVSGKWQYLVMAIVLSVAGTAFYSFVMGWLGPTYDAGTGLDIIAIVGLVATLLAAWIPLSPNQPGKAHYTHMASAAIAGLAMPAITGVVLTRGGINDVLGLTLGTLMIAVAAVFLFLYVFIRSTRAHFLIYQSIYVALFALNIIVLTLG